MKTRLLITAVSAASLITVVDASADHIWINEFHYDNTSTDLGEFVEVAVRSGPAFNPADYTLTLYDGGGAPYGSVIGLESFTASAPFTISGSPSTVTFYTFSFPTNGIQNGPADGLALTLDPGPNTVVQFISYEGSFMATSGFASGAVSVDVGVSEPGTALGTSIGYIGTGDRAANFSYALISDDTPGAVNAGQTLRAVAVGVPESGNSAGLLAISTLGILSASWLTVRRT